MKVVIVEDEFVAAQNLERMIQEVDGSTGNSGQRCVREPVECFR